MTFLIMGKSKVEHIWNKYSNTYKTEGYELKDVFEILLPFWECKQRVVFEKNAPLDEFSLILLGLIDNGISSRANICEFLGIDEDCFAVMQIKYLLKNNLIEEDEKVRHNYEITFEGRQFLQDKTRKIKSLETDEIEFLVFMTNDLTQSFFDPNTPIDTQISECTKHRFGGYKIGQTHQIQNFDGPIIEHTSRSLGFDYIEKRRNNFVKFVNRIMSNSNKIFYDFRDENLKAYQRSICFYGLLYVNNDNPDDKKLDIRRSEKSVKRFDTEVLEETMSKRASKYLSDNPNFLTKNNVKQ